MNKTAVAIAVALTTLSSYPAQAGVIWADNGHEYDIIAASGITWTAARAAVQALGAGWDLATITSSSENIFVVNTLLPASAVSRSHYWLGATDSAVEGTFAWVTGEAFSYSNFWPGEPNNSGNENYLAYDLRGSSWAWNDVPNNFSGVYGYVIERAGQVAVPEPASLALLGIGLAGLGAMRRRKMG